jgi:nitrilase
MHLFDALIGETVHSESTTVAPGTDLAAVQCAGFTAGCAICFDLRFPVLFSRLRERGADLIFVPSAFTAATGKAHWEVLLRARAIENQVFIAAAAQAGTDGGGIKRHGCSMIIDPWGTVLKQGSASSPDIITCDIDLARVQDIRKRIPMKTNRFCE